MNLALVLAWRLCSLLPDGTRLKELWQVSGITCRGLGRWCRCPGWAGGEAPTINPLSCSCYMLEFVVAGQIAAVSNHNQESMDGASVCTYWGFSSCEHAEEVELLLGFIGQGCCVNGQGEIWDVHTQDPGATNSLQNSAADGQRSVLGVHPPEIHNSLLCLLHSQRGCYPCLVTQVICYLIDCHFPIVFIFTQSQSTPTPSLMSYQLFLWCNFSQERRYSRPTKEQCTTAIEYWEWANKRISLRPSRADWHIFLWT